MVNKLITIGLLELGINTERNGLSSTLHIIGVMFRRRFRGRRRSGRRKQNQITHIPSSMSNTLVSNTALVFHAAIPANYGTIGSPLTGDTFENADRERQNVVGSKIDSISFNISARLPQAAGVIEWGILKIERANEVPDTNGNLLPSDADIVASGLQSALRRYQPGRVLKFGTFAVAPEQPRTISVGVSFAKFKMSTIRTGDYYSLVVFNRGIAASLVIDIQSRYKSYQ